MSNDNISLETTIKAVEDFYFGKTGDCGLNFFNEFAQQYETAFSKSNISESTENKFEFTEIHRKYQSYFEKKLESIIKDTGMTIKEFYEALKKKCDDGDQEVMIFVEIMNAVLEYNAFIDMMSNYILNKK